MSTQPTVNVGILINDHPVRYLQQVGDVPLLAGVSDLLSIKIKDPGLYLVEANLLFADSEHEIAPFEGTAKLRRIWIPVSSRYFQLSLCSTLDNEIIKVHFKCIDKSNPEYSYVKEKGDVGISFDVRLNQDMIDRMLGPFGHESLPCPLSHRGED